ncbi:hydrolase [Methylocaldum marinum]|uniref:Hydrolase n=1 Tax=Methylocaldum marinum TaxID=1432792 RepID=A0A286T733_9GAMM|nr:YqiA/YcfP family alpha/beta fold hydrolase [Methylocaldum marinum]BBA32046.1 hydrolase [Methylocaldum marinum]
MIIYLHGFRSSPASAKARLLARHMAERGMADRFWCEQLPVGPRQAIEAIEAVLSQSRTVPTLVGSSLGGYYATYLAEKHDLRAALINPAAVAYETLAPFVGPQTNLYTGETFEFTSRHLAELEQLDVPRIARPEHFWLLVETGDEVLDYRQAVRKYAGARQTVIDGGDHSFRHFSDFLDAIVDFAEQRAP